MHIAFCPPLDHTPTPNSVRILVPFGHAQSLSHQNTHTIASLTTCTLWGPSTKAHYHTTPTMFRTLARRAAQNGAASQPQQHASEYVQRMAKLYPPKKVWPPDFKRLSPQERLGFEKRYKRRLRLATARPRWDKFTKLAQLFSIVCTSRRAYLKLFSHGQTDTRSSHYHLRGPVLGMERRRTTIPSCGCSPCCNWGHIPTDTICRFVKCSGMRLVPTMKSRRGL